MIDSTLLAVLDDLERRPRVAAVRFTDGEVYDLRVISTMHAEEGGDVVAEVVHNVTSRSPNTVPDGAFINLYLADVEQITLNGVCVFDRESAASQSVAADPPARAADLGRESRESLPLSILPYTIDDPIADPLSACVEVTVDFDDGHKRWCFFATPVALASCGDWVEGTQVRLHLGVPHMIIVSELNEGIIDRVLRQLHARGELKAHTAPLA